MTQNYSAQQVRLYDYDRYVTTLFAPRESRAALWSLYAFHYEIARIKSMTREQMMGLIRLQWWRDAIAALYRGQVLRHQVIEELAPFITHWQEEDFYALLDGYEADLQINDFKDDTERLAHIERLAHPLMRMACQVTCPSINADNVKKVATSYEAVRQFYPLPESLSQEIRKNLSKIDRKIVNNCAPLLLYYCAQYRLAYPGRATTLLSFYLWRKRLFA